MIDQIMLFLVIAAFITISVAFGASLKDKVQPKEVRNMNVIEPNEQLTHIVKVTRTDGTSITCGPYSYQKAKDELDWIIDFVNEEDVPANRLVAIGDYESAIWVSAIYCIDVVKLPDTGLLSVS
jgi:hypothetical protein